MSLYSALTQVLAPFAAKIKGIQTGYDGTEYENPGEAVREQINDLHVLIGHVPGQAIDASAVAYNDSNVAAELTNVNGRLDEQEEIVNTLNEGGLDIKDDVIEAQINEWLNNHPEATTTVQEGSLSVNKLAPDFKNLVQTFSEKYVSNSDGAISIIGDTALSYMKYTTDDESTEFFYDRSGLYNNWGTKPTQKVDGKHGITCSPFVVSLLFGVPYERSAYIDGVNRLNKSMLKDEGLIDWFSVPNIGAQYIAQYALNNGYAFYPKTDLSNVVPGDVIFTTLDDSADKFMGIGHCEIMGYWTNNKRFLVWQSGSVPRSNVRTAADYASKVVLCARFPFVAEQAEIKNIVVQGQADTPRTVSGQWVVKDYDLSEELEPNRYYTAIFKMTSENSIADQYPSIKFSPDTTISATTSNGTEKPQDNIYCIPFYTDESGHKSIRLAMKRATDNVEYKEVTVYWMVVTKGIVTQPIDFVQPKSDAENERKALVKQSAVTAFTPINGNAYPNFDGCFYYKIGTRVHVHVGISDLVENTTTTIFQMPAGFRPVAQFVAIGQGDSIKNKSTICISATGTVKIVSDKTFACADIEYDAFG